MVKYKKDTTKLSMRIDIVNTPDMLISSMLSAVANTFLNAAFIIRIFSPLYRKQKHATKNENTGTAIKCRIWGA